MLGAMCLVPLMEADLRCPLSLDVTASDASETGGAFVCSQGLIPVGVQEGFALSVGRASAAAFVATALGHEA